MFDEFLFQQYLGHATNVFCDYENSEELFEAFGEWYIEYSWWVGEYCFQEAYERLVHRIDNMRENTNTDLIDLSHIIAADAVVQYFLALHIYGCDNLDDQIEASCDAYVY